MWVFFIDPKFSENSQVYIHRLAPETFPRHLWLKANPEGAVSAADEPSPASGSIWRIHKQSK